MRMGAKPRTRVAGMYHVWGNAVAGSDLFIDPLDYLFALELVSEAVDRGGFDCNALCFVDTHYHLVVSTARDELLSTRMQRLNRRYAIRCNRKYGRRGHVFDGPFESEVVVHHLEPWLVYVIFKVSVDGMELLPGDGAIITSWEGP